MTLLPSLLLALLPWQWSVPFPGLGDVPWFRLAALIIIGSSWAVFLAAPRPIRMAPVIVWLWLGFLMACLGSIFFLPEAHGWERKFIFLAGLLPLTSVWYGAFSRGATLSLIRALLIGALSSAGFGLIIFLSQFVVGIERPLHMLIADLYPFFLGDRLAELVATFPSLLVNIGGTTWLRLTAVFPDPHGAAFFFGMTACLAYGAFLETRVRFFFWAALLLVLADCLTFSRGGYVGLAAAIMVGLFFQRASGRLMKVALVVIGLLPVTIWAALPVIERFISIFTAADASSQDRFALWGVAFETWLRHPILGVGLGQYADTVLPMVGAGLPYYAHNLYLDIGVETGLIGLASFLALIGAALVAAWRGARAGSGLSLGALAALSAYLAHSLFETALFSLHVMVLLTFVLALGFWRPLGVGESQHTHPTTAI